MSPCFFPRIQRLLGWRTDPCLCPATIIVPRILRATRETGGRVCVSHCTARPLPGHEEEVPTHTREHLDPTTLLLGHVALSCCFWKPWPAGWLSLPSGVASPGCLRSRRGPHHRGTQCSETENLRQHLTMGEGKRCARVSGRVENRGLGSDGEGIRAHVGVCTIQVGPPNLLHPFGQLTRARNPLWRNRSRG